MTKYLLKRFLYIIPTFFILTAIVFFVLAMAPGDPVLMILGNTATEQQVAALTHELGLDQPLVVRYFTYIWDLFHGDMGNSWIGGQTVFSDFVQRFPNTLYLSLFSLCLTIIVGIPLGVIAAVHQNSSIDRFTLVLALFFISVPAFFIALLAQLLFSIKLGWLPVSGSATWKHFLMPTVILSASQIATQVRMTRSSMLDVLSQDYIRTAYAKGSSKFRVITYHALRNGLLPVITSIGNSVAYLFSGAAIIEMVYAIPGLGTMMINAVYTTDVPMVMGPIVFTAVLVSVVNMVVDMAYAFIDPRIKLRYLNE